MQPKRCKLIALMLVLVNLLVLLPKGGLGINDSEDVSVQYFLTFEKETGLVGVPGTHSVGEIPRTADELFEQQYTDLQLTRIQVPQYNNSLTGATGREGVGWSNATLPLNEFMIPAGQESAFSSQIRLTTNTSYFDTVARYDFTGTLEGFAGGAGASGNFSNPTSVSITEFVHTDDGNPAVNYGGATEARADACKKIFFTLPALTGIYLPLTATAYVKSVGGSYPPYSLRLSDSGSFVENWITFSTEPAISYRYTVASDTGLWAQFPYLPVGGNYAIQRMDYYWLAASDDYGAGSWRPYALATCSKFGVESGRLIMQTGAAETISATKTYAWGDYLAAHENDIVTVGFNTTSTHAISLSADGVQWALTSEGNGNFGAQVKNFTLTAPLTISSLAIDASLGANQYLSIDYIEIRRPLMPTVKVEMQTQHSGTFYNESVAMEMGAFTENAYCDYNYTLSASSSDFWYWGGADDCTVIEQNASLCLYFTKAALVYSYVSLFNYSSSSWRVPSEITLYANGEEVTDSARNAGYCSFDTFQTSLAFTCDESVMLATNLTTYLSLNRDLEVVSKTYLRDSFYLQTAALTIYRIETTGVSNVLHLYINGIDFGPYASASTSISIEPFSITKVEIILSSPIHVPLIPYYSNLGSGTYAYYCTGRFNALAYNDISRFSDLGITLPSGFDVEQANLTFGDLRYTPAYTPDPANDTSSFWREGAPTPNPTQSYSDSFSQFPHGPASTSLSAWANETGYGEMNYVESTTGQNELYSVLSEDLSPASATITDGTPTGALGSTNTSDDVYYTVASEFNDTADYNGIYTFTYDTPGSPPSAWVCTNDANNYARVYNGAGGPSHHLPVEIYSTTGASPQAVNHFSAQDYGTVEWWWWNAATNKRAGMCIGDSGCYVYMLDDGHMWAYDLSTLTDLGAYSAATWYHFRVEFDCDGTGPYGLAADRFNVYINGVSVGANFQFNIARSEFSEVSFWFGWAGTGNFLVDAVDYSWASGYYVGRNHFTANSTALNASFSFELAAEVDSALVKNYTLTYEIGSNVSATFVTSVYNNQTGLFQTVVSDTFDVEATFTIINATGGGIHLSGRNVTFNVYRGEGNASTPQLTIDYLHLTLYYYNLTELPPDITLLNLHHFRLNENQTIVVQVSESAYAVDFVKAYNNLTGANVTIGAGAGVFYYNLSEFVDFACNLTLTFYVSDVYGKMLNVTVTNVAIYNPGILPDLFVSYLNQTVVGQANSFQIRVYANDWNIAGIWLWNNRTLLNTSLGVVEGVYYYYYANASVQTYLIQVTVLDAFGQFKQFTISDLAVIYNETRPSIILHYQSLVYVNEDNYINITATSDLVAEVIFGVGSNSTLGTGPGQYGTNVAAVANYSFSVYVVDDYGFVQNLSVLDVCVTKYNCSLDFLALAKHYWQNDTVNATLSIDVSSIRFYDPAGGLFLSGNTTFYTNTSSTSGWYRVVVELNSTTYLDTTRTMSFELLPVQRYVNSTDVALTVNTIAVSDNFLALNYSNAIAIDSLDNCTFDLSISILANNSQSGIAYSEIISFGWEFNQTTSFSTYTVGTFEMGTVPTNFTNYYYNSALSTNYTLAGTTLTVNQAATLFHGGNSFSVVLSRNSAEIHRTQVTSTPTTADSYVTFTSRAYTDRTFGYYYWETDEALASLSLVHDRTAATITSFENVGFKYYFAESSIAGDTFSVTERITPAWTLSPSWIINNGTYTEISLTYAAALAITNVTAILDLGTTLNERWEFSQAGLTYTQVNASFQLQIHDLNFTDSVQTLTIRGYSSIPIATVTGYANAGNRIALDREFEFNAYLQYGRYSQAYFVPIQSDWSVYGVEYGRNNYSCEVVSDGYALVRADGLDPTIEDSYLYFRAYPFRNVSIDRQGSQWVITIDSQFNLTDTYFLFFWDESQTHTLSSPNGTSLAHLTDRGYETAGIPSSYLFFFYNVTAGVQTIVIDIRYMSAGEYLTSGLWLFITGGAFCAVWIAHKKRPEWFVWTKRIKVPEKIVRKLKRDRKTARSIEIVGYGDKLEFKVKK